MTLIKYKLYSECHISLAKIDALSETFGILGKTS